MDFPALLFILPTPVILIPPCPPVPFSLPPATIPRIIAQVRFQLMEMAAHAVDWEHVDIFCFKQYLDLFPEEDAPLVSVLDDDFLFFEDLDLFLEVFEILFLFGG